MLPFTNFSISAPVQFCILAARRRSYLVPYRLFIIERILSRSSGEGRSTKKMSSNLRIRAPWLMDSNSSMSLQVITKNTGSVHSCISVRKSPNMEDVVPPSVWLAGAFHPSKDLFDLFTPYNNRGNGLDGLPGIPCVL